MIETARFPAAMAAVALFAFALIGDARAQNPVMTLVVAPQAVVHTEPSADSAPLGSVRAEDVVLVFVAQGDWVKIEFQAADGNWTAGWVLREALRLKKTVPDVSQADEGPGYQAGRADTYENGYGAVYHLNLDHAALDCVRDIEVGFNSCTVDLQTSMETTFNGANEPRVHFLCDADLIATDRDGGAKKYPVNGRGEVLGRAGVGQVQLFTNLYPEVPLRHVRIGGIACRISGITE